MLKYRVYLENYWEAQLDEIDYVDYTEHFTEDKPCNIYLVGLRPRVMINKDSFEIIDNKSISLEFVRQTDLMEYVKYNVTVELPREIRGELLLETVKPYSRFQLRDDEGVMFKDDMSNDSPPAKAFYILRKSLKDIDLIQEINDLDVVYIGKSLKLDKAVPSVKRVEGSHQKLKKVLEECNKEYIYDEVYVLLCSFVQKVSFIATGEEMIAAGGANNAIDKALIDMKFLDDNKEFRTRVSEATLIDFYNTEDFNVDFIGSFGRKTHKYYPNLTQKSISEVSLEVDLRKLCRTHSVDIEPRYYQAVSYNPQHNFDKEIRVGDLPQEILDI